MVARKEARAYEISRAKQAPLTANTAAAKKCKGYLVLSPLHTSPRNGVVRACDLHTGLDRYLTTSTARRFSACSRAVWAGQHLPADRTVLSSPTTTALRSRRSVIRHSPSAMSC